MSGSASFTFFCSTHLGKAVWSRNTAVLKRDHLLSAVSWVKNKGSEVLGDHTKLFSEILKFSDLWMWCSLFPIGNRASLVGKLLEAACKKADRDQILWFTNTGLFWWHNLRINMTNWLSTGFIESSCSGEPMWGAWLAPIGFIKYLCPACTQPA